MLVDVAQGGSVGVVALLWGQARAGLWYLTAGGGARVGVVGVVWGNTVLVSIVGWQKVKRTPLVAEGLVGRYLTRMATGAKTEVAISSEVVPAAATLVQFVRNQGGRW